MPGTQHEFIIKLLGSLFDYLLRETDSFEDGYVGEDFAYFVGAVTKGSRCLWPEDRKFIQLLRRWEDDEQRCAAFNYIDIEEEEE